MDECEEQFLQAARNGDEALLWHLLDTKKKEHAQFNINCKGRAKSNHGWTPLHLSCYFGHEKVAEVLLQHEADVNVLNDAGDTPLHKAAFTGRESIVILLLKYNADVCIINGEGQLAKEVALVQDIRKLIEGAEKADIKRKENQLLEAAREGDLEMLNKLLHGSSPPSINCVDSSGNTALHCAAYREQKEVAVILLQNGIDSTVRNLRGQTALQLARSSQMKQILDVQPIKKLIKHVARFEGSLLKRSRFMGWQGVWAVLERGVLTYFKSRADACSGVKRKGYKHLNEAKIMPFQMDVNNIIVIHFSDNTVHRVAVPNCSEENGLGFQKWINALQEHIAYCTHYMSQGLHRSDSDEEQELLPLGSMQDALKTAQAHQQILQSNINTLPALLSDERLKTSAFEEVHQWLCQVSENASKMITSLQHCLTIFTQQEEIRQLQLKQEQEKCRVLEDALHVLAKEHHELEQSITSPFHTPKKTRSPRFYDTSDDEFYDAFEGESEEGSPNHPAIISSSTSFSSLSTLVAEDLSELATATEGLSIATLGAKKASSNETSECSEAGTLCSSSDNLQLLHHSSLSSRSETLSSLDSSHYVSVASRNSNMSHSTDRRHRRIRRKGNESAVKGPNVLPYSRSCLPVPMFARNDYSVWSILKQCIGKELSKITMPIIFNEPLSFLQRLSEYMEYSFLLNEACRCQDPIERLEYIAAFAVSALASNWERVGKPFNPLLGETYELERDTFRIVCEQVSHHPPISAFHADSPKWLFHGSILPKLRFWGKSVEIQPKGIITVELPEHDEVYTWHNVNCCIHNIIVGKLWIEQYGVLEVVNHKTGHKCTINFKPSGWFSRDLHKVEGFLVDKKKTRLRYLYGKWTDLLKTTDVDSYEEYLKSNPHRFKSSHDVNNTPRGTPSGSPAHTPKKTNKINSLLSFGGSSFSSATPPPSTDEPPNGFEGFAEGSSLSQDEEEPPRYSSTYSLDIPNSTTLWEAEPRPADSEKYYQFTLFAMSLNEMLPGMRESIAPTDSRIRPDIRKLEEGDIDGAAEEKNRLEEKQRDARKNRKKAKEKENWKPKWFKACSNPHVKEDDWVYTGGYWDRDYSTCPDIF